jgi:hypothetical protein
MSLGFLQRMALKKFTKNYIKVLPFDLSNDDCLGFSAALFTASMVSHFSATYDVFTNYEKHSKIREDAKQESIALFASLTQTSFHRVEGLISRANNAFLSDSDDTGFAEDFYSEAISLTSYSSVFETKERLSKLFQAYKQLKAIS